MANHEEQAQAEYERFAEAQNRRRKSHGEAWLAYLKNRRANMDEQFRLLAEDMNADGMCPGWDELHIDVRDAWVGAQRVIFLCDGRYELRRHGVAGLFYNPKQEMVKEFDYLMVPSTGLWLAAVPHDGEGLAFVNEETRAIVRAANPWADKFGGYLTMQIDGERFQHPCWMVGAPIAWGHAASIHKRMTLPELQRADSGG